MVIIDTIRCDYLLLFIIILLHRDEVTSSDEDLTSSNEPTKTDICNEIMEGLQDALEM